ADEKPRCPKGHCRLRALSLHARRSNCATRSRAGGASTHHRTLAATRADEFLSAAHRSQRLQRRPRCRDLESVRFGSDQTNHAPETPAEERSGKVAALASCSGGL